MDNYDLDFLNELGQNILLQESNDFENFEDDYDTSEIYNKIINKKITHKDGDIYKKAIKLIISKKNIYYIYTLLNNKIIKYKDGDLFLKAINSLKPYTKHKIENIFNLLDNRIITIKDDKELFLKLVRKVFLFGKSKGAAEELLTYEIITRKDDPELYQEIFSEAIKSKTGRYNLVLNNIITRENNSKLFWKIINAAFKDSNLIIYIIHFINYETVTRKDGDIFWKGINRIIIIANNIHKHIEKNPDTFKHLPNFVNNPEEQSYDSVKYLNEFKEIIDNIYFFLKDKIIIQKDGNIFYKYVDILIKQKEPVLSLLDPKIPKDKEYLDKFGKETELESPMVDIKTHGFASASINTVKEELIEFFMEYFKSHNEVIFTLNGEINNFTGGGSDKTEAHILTIKELRLAVNVRARQFKNFLEKYKSLENKKEISIELKSKKLKYIKKIAEDLAEVMIETSDIIVGPPADLTPYIFVHGSWNDDLQGKSFDYLSTVPINRWQKWSAYAYIVSGPPASFKIKNEEIPAILIKDAFSHRVKYYSDRKLFYSLPLEKVKYLLDKNVLIKANEINSNLPKFKKISQLYECLVYKPKILFKLGADKMHSLIKTLESNPNYKKLFLMLIADKRRTIEQKQEYFNKAKDYMGKTGRMEENVNFQLNKMFDL